MKDCLIFLDDQEILSRNSESQKVLQKFATRASHHTNSSVVYTSHSYFSQSLRLIQLNTQYFCVYKFARDRSAISHLSRQLPPGNSSCINSAYRRAVESRDQGAYVFINLYCRNPMVLPKSRVPICAKSFKIFQHEGESIPSFPGMTL